MSTLIETLLEFIREEDTEGFVKLIKFLIERGDFCSLDFVAKNEKITFLEQQDLFRELCWLIEPESTLTDDEYQKILAMINLIANRLGERTFGTFPSILDTFVKITGHPGVVELLVHICTTKFGFEIPDRFQNISSYLIYRAIFADNFFLVEAVFKKYGKNFERDEYLLLSEATKLNRVKIVKFLIASGVHPSVKDYRGNTALHYCHSPEIAGFLIWSGADFEARNELGENPLMKACKNRRVDMVNYFVNERGADPKLVDAKGHDAEWHAKHEIRGKKVSHRTPTVDQTRILAILNGTSGESTT